MIEFKCKMDVDKVGTKSLNSHSKNSIKIQWKKTKGKKRPFQ